MLLGDNRIGTIKLFPVQWTIRFVCLCVCACFWQGGFRVALTAEALLQLTPKVIVQKRGAKEPSIYLPLPFKYRNKYSLQLKIFITINERVSSNWICLLLLFKYRNKYLLWPNLFIVVNELLYACLKDENELEMMFVKKICVSNCIYTWYNYRKSFKNILL